MERIFPFLHEDVLFLINEFAIEKTEKKELHEDLFNIFLKRNLSKMNIRDAWIHWLIGMDFKDMKTFIHILELSHSEYLNRSYRLHSCARNEKEIILFQDYNRIPLGPRLKLYHYFINGLRYNQVYGLFRNRN
tara:strand:- start:13899 stop:14297 length:399 start_codon:yes stop_codon:yes gene_type:complete